MAAQAEAAQQNNLQLGMVYFGKLCLCLMYIIVSACLIRYNKLMMQKDHFPHSLALSCIHMVVSSLFCGGLYMVCPFMFPAMETTKGNRLSLLKWFVPIGVCFAIMLFGSNQAYLYCSVTFLQFMKEANVMLVFIISCAVGLQSANRMKTLIIIWVIAGASISVSGEVHFKWAGFIYQAVSQLAECSRMVMGEIVLSGRKLDPLTYTLFLAPICLIVLAIANAVHWSPNTLHDLAQWWPLLIGNACVAFLLNVLVACVIKECSAVGFVLCGLTKDMVIVIFSAVFFHEQVTSNQAVAFVITILGVFYWSYVKTAPESPLVKGVERMLCMPPKEAAEADPLIKDTAAKKV
eukprot:CAMPEP_0197873702 /NCGR_PEP_ID=MMETSP1439-20131203/3425_1 /TAXON_ID=66791 /ORGANISM="Gonyaulax spinifera, Strain CCMP409" /LENGTH=348 /DNA_ID=CAMNT_0043492765 /DNA_START=67 /DNA_END=1113 /DNA_ORIENTATION=+